MIVYRENASNLRLPDLGEWVEGDWENEMNSFQGTKVELRGGS
jgi:hypothetical protein